VHVVQANIKLWIGLCHLRCVVAAAEFGSFRRRRARYREVRFAPDEGLVERREDPTDRRAKMLHLTALGEKRADEIDGISRRVRAHLLKNISGEDLTATFEVLQRIEHRASRLLDAALEKTRS
jgi:hypothetical protein